MNRKVIGLLACSAVACGGDRSDGAGGAGGAGAGERTRDATPDVAVRDERPVVLFFGTSLTAGLGLEPQEAYPALVQRKVDAAGLGFRTVNAGVSGETSAAGLRRIDWLLREPIHVLVLEHGANDALRGQDLAATKRNLRQIIARTRARYPEVRIVIAGMEAPPNLGERYTREFRRLFVDLARETDAALIPFLLAGVAGVAELNQPDGIHPNAEGARIVADNVWRVLARVLRQPAAARAPAGGKVGSVNPDWREVLPRRVPRGARRPGVAGN